MVTATIRDARARLNHLVNRALAGEDVVLLRGSRHVVALVPISDADLELSLRISDAQADRLWERVRAERAAGRALEFESLDAAVVHLRKSPAPRKRR